MKVRVIKESSHPKFGGVMHSRQIKTSQLLKLLPLENFPDNTRSVAVRPGPADRDEDLWAEYFNGKFYLTSPVSVHFWAKEFGINLVETK